MKALLRAGADVNARDFSGETALMKASRAGLMQVVKTLLEAGANPSIVSQQNSTALSWALRYQHTEIVELIQQAQGQQQHVK